MMAKKFIHGFDGSFARAPSGASPAAEFVAMESPCPYSQWAMQTPTSETNGTLSSGSGYVRLTCTNNSTGSMGGTVDVLMLATENNGTISVACVKNGSVNYGVANVAIKVGATQVDTLQASTVSGSDSGSVPYYRYRLTVELSAGLGGLQVGDYVQANFTLSA
jgi:hypothetical protein